MITFTCSNLIINTLEKGVNIVVFLTLNMYLFVGISFEQNIGVVL